MRMTFSPLQNDLIFAILDGKTDKDNLYSYFVNQKKYSRAGFYRAVSILRTKEIIIEKKSLLAVNKVWLSASIEGLRKFQTQHYAPSYLAEQIDSLLDGEKLVYSFKRLSEVDVFILNILFDLLLKTKCMRLLIREPHEFFTIINVSRTKNILHSIRELGGEILLLVESDSLTDTEAVRRISNIRPHVTKKHSHNPRVLEHLVGNVHIELKLDKSFADSLEKIYRGGNSLEEILSPLGRLAEKPAKHQITISKNPARGAKLKKEFAKYFVMN